MNGLLRQRSLPQLFLREDRSAVQPVFPHILVNAVCLALGCLVNTRTPEFRVNVVLCGPSSIPQISLGSDRICHIPPARIPHMNKKFMQPVNILAPNDQSVPGVAQSVMGKALTIQDSLQIKAAEYWLKLGEADQALKELEALPSRSWKCGWALKTRIVAMGALRERDERPTQA
jgi:hypothetical protein